MPHEVLSPAIPFWFGAALASCIVLVALFKGVIPLRVRPIARKDDPPTFWYVLTLILLGGAFSAFVALSLT